MEDRLDGVYKFLVDETENRITLTDRKKNEMLSFLLEVFEYLMYKESNNPIEEYFNDF